MLKDFITWTERREVAEAKTPQGQKHKNIPIINPNKYHEFFPALRDTDELTLMYKAFLGVIVSSGMRVSEGLSIRLKDYDKSKGRIKFKVLKKRTEEVDKKTGEVTYYKDTHRTLTLNPIAQDLLDAYIARTNPKHFSFIFTFNRTALNKVLVKIFGKGAGPHTIARHTFISYLLQKEEYTVAQLTSFMKLSADTWKYYSHVDEEDEGARIHRRAG